MTELVLDASTAVTWLLEDEMYADTSGILELVREGRALVPQLWHYEVANALLTAQRQGRLPEGGARERLDSLDVLPIFTDHEADLRDALDISLLRGLSIYDALYVELARRRRLPLATLDSGLGRAALAEGLDVVA